MADGALLGRRAAMGQVTHTDGNATDVVSLTLPSAVDAIFYVEAKMTGTTNTGTNDVVGRIIAQVRMDGASATAMVESEEANFQATGYSMALATTGAAVRLTVTAANGQRSVGSIEAFGVEMAITPP